MFQFSDYNLGVFPFDICLYKSLHNFSFIKNKKNMNIQNVLVRVIYKLNKCKLAWKSITSNNYLKKNPYRFNSLMNTYWKFQWNQLITRYFDKILKTQGVKCELNFEGSYRIVCGQIFRHLTILRYNDSNSRCKVRFRNRTGILTDMFK